MLNGVIQLRSFLISALLLGGLAILASSRLAGVVMAGLPPSQEENLLQNPGFENGFHAWSGINEIRVGNSWTPWWWDNPDHDPPYFRPEYKRAAAANFPRRVFSGDSAQQWFTFHASHLAGMYQQVFNVTPGQRYRFTIWAQVWSSIEDDPNVSVLPANPHLQVGIDPTGLWNAGSPDVVWSAEGAMSSLIDQWAPISVEATAENDIITVFMRTRPEFANKHNDMYWDNASLVAVGPPEPTPLPPSATPGPPTNTPPVANTLPPTVTPEPPLPSNTPSPTMTGTPTDAPLPSATPVPATPTLTPTSSATPSRSPSPTAVVPTQDLATATPIPEAADTVRPTAVATAKSTEVSALLPSPGPTEPSPSESVESGGEEPAVGLFILGAGIFGLLVAAGYVLARRQSAG